MDKRAFIEMLQREIRERTNKSFVEALSAPTGRRPPPHWTVMSD
jgi:hypothetical protein